jgi:hypothetical protein
MKYSKIKLVAQRAAYILYLNTLLFCFFFSSCTRSLYGPSDLQIAPLAKDNDNRIGGQLQSVAETTGFGLNGVYAIRPNISIKGQTGLLFGAGTYEMFDFFSGALTQQKIRGLASQMEASVGLHRQLTDRWWGGVFAGGGMNKISFWYEGADKSSLNYSSVFIQPELVLTTKYADFGLGCRGASISYFKGKIDGDIIPDDLDNIYRLDKSSNLYTFEPSAMLGGSIGRWYLRNSITWLLNPPDDLPFARLQFATSLIYQLQPGDFKRKSKKTNM